MSQKTSRHLTDETLLLLIDNDLAEERIAEANAHLAECDACTMRLKQLRSFDSTIAAPEPEASGDNTARDSLAERMHTSGRERFWLRPPLLLRAAMVIALVALGFAFRQAYNPLQDQMGAYEETGPKPIHSITPGSVRPIELSDICIMADDNLDPAVAPEKQRAVFAAYRIDEKASRYYQVDYLINPQLGGNDDIENLWPEPYHATVWNARAKDALETRLHRMVCRGQISLADAQSEIATNWIDAYKKRFHVNRPVDTQAENISPETQATQSLH